MHGSREKLFPWLNNLQVLRPVCTCTAQAQAVIICLSFLSLPCGKAMPSSTSQQVALECCTLTSADVLFESSKRSTSLFPSEHLISNELNLTIGWFAHIIYLIYLQNCLHQDGKRTRPENLSVPAPSYVFSLYLTLQNIILGSHNNSF